MDVKKEFSINGDLRLRFASDSKEQIVEWLDKLTYDFAINFAEEVNCPVFGKALEFPCEIKKQKL